MVEERLKTAVAQCFAVLQSLLNNMHDHAAVKLGSQFIACVSLFLYLQNIRSSDSVSFWLPMRIQEQSAGATKVKRYVTSDRLGIDDNSPLLQFPSVCGGLVENLDPNVHPVATPPVLC